jgi:hypothetical protein
MGLQLTGITYQPGGVQVAMDYLAQQKFAQMHGPKIAAG